MPQSRLVQNIDMDHEILRCITDADGHLVYVSPALSWACGRTRKDLLETRVCGLVRLYEDNGREVTINAAKSGFYNAVVERSDRDPYLVTVRLDHIKRGQESFRVLWFDKEPTAFINDEFQENSTLYLEQVEAMGYLPGHEKPKSPKIDNINIDDSELRHFINLSNELFGVYRREGSFVRVNYAFNRVLGYPDQELRKFPFLQLIHPEDRPAIEHKINQVIDAPPDNEIRVDFECRSVCKDSQVKWIEWVLKSAEDYIYIVGRDVTDIRDQEMQLNAREAQLFKAQKIGRMGHWSWEVGAREMDWSHQLYTIFDVDYNNFKPSFANIHALMACENKGKLKSYFDKALLDGRDFTLEFEIKDANGEERFIRCESRCHTNDKTGSVDRIFGIFQDITERTLHEKELREAKEAAETAYASKTRFLANMSHELRTPLNAIIGFSEMMQRQLLGPMGNAKYLDYIGGIRESGEHLLDLINDILDMSKIEFGKYDLEFEDINLAKITRLVVHMMEGRAHESDVRLIAEDIPDDIHVFADRRAVMQILLNLMSNAVKFTPAGGQVEIRCARQGNDSVTIIVRDTGVGIPKNKIPLITLPFEQVASALTRPHEGSGLGLAITKDLIKLHNGEIHISSKVGQGTEVSVYLPTNIAKSKQDGHSSEGEKPENVFAIQ